MTYLIFDAAVLGILILFAFLGAKRGFILSLCGLLALLVAFVGASFAARLLSPKVSAALEPKFAAAIEEQLDRQIHQPVPPSQTPALPDGEGDTGEPAEEPGVPLIDVLDILRDMGFYESVVDAIDNAVEQGLTTAAASMAAAVAASIAGSVAYVVLFLIAFLLIMLIWTIFSHALDLVAKLPGLNALNRTAGLLIGVVKGCAILFLIAWALRFSGQIIPEETVNQTHLLRFFMTTNPVSLITGI